jgi:hypothetical protein
MQLRPQRVIRLGGCGWLDSLSGNRFDGLSVFWILFEIEAE